MSEEDGRGQDMEDDDDILGIPEYRSTRLRMLKKIHTEPQEPACA